MAKVKTSATSDFNKLTSDLLNLAEGMKDVVLIAADAEMEVLADAIKTNWVTMIPQGHVGDFVYDSIGYNVDIGFNGTGNVAGMAGVFDLDSVVANHGLTKDDFSAPQLSYWAEYGTYSKAGVPYTINAYVTTENMRVKTFTDVLMRELNKRQDK